MTYKIIKLIVATLAFTIVALAADINGKWTAKVPGRNGEVDATFTFKQTGETFTGTLTNPQGDMPISEGKITGEAITFTVESPRGKQSYAGTLTGAEMKLKRQNAQFEAREFVAKKAN